MQLMGVVEKAKAKHDRSGTAKIAISILVLLVGSVKLDTDTVDLV